jgi:hypothetical protein
MTQPRHTPQDILLHLGAHRTGTTTFQDWLARNDSALADLGIGSLRPPRTRLATLCDSPLPACDRLIVSEENLLGPMSGCIEAGVLYPIAPLRLDDLAAWLGAPRVILFSVRNTADWWNSAVSFKLREARRLPSAAQVAAMHSGLRRWSDVARDIRRAFPDARIVIRDFGFRTGNPAVQVARATGWPGLDAIPVRRMNRNALPVLDAAALDGFDPADRAAIAARLHGGRIELFDPDIRARMDADYLADLDRIAASGGFEMMGRPGRVRRAARRGAGPAPVGTGPRPAR